MIIDYQGSASKQKEEKKESTDELHAEKLACVVGDLGILY